MAKNIHAVSDTHQVFNQTPEFKDYNAYQIDPSLQSALHDNGAGWAEARVDRYGAVVGGELRDAGFVANVHLPQLDTHDRYGHRIDEVSFHPSYHALMRAAIGSGWPTLPWSEPQPGAHVARAAMAYLHHQADSGTGCPLTMTFAALSVIRRCPVLAKVWEPLVCSGRYDPENKAYFNKSGVTIGMGLTEKQGGTDVRANTTTATALAGCGPGKAYELEGHKWFFSAPMCDAFLVLAQAKQGLGCFLMPRWRPDGSRNQVFVQRLKDKMGNRSNASAEVEFRGALAWLIGEEGRGVTTILEMVALTRFDCIVGSTGLMRQATVQAIHHCRHRQVDGQYLIEKPLMQNVLAGLVVETDAALALGMRLAAALDNQDHDPKEKLFVRAATAIGKYWVCRRATGLIMEAMECLGGNAYIEDSILPRLYREAPVNAIWEGSSNVQCLDVLRAHTRDKGGLAVVVEEIEKAKGLNTDLDNHLLMVKDELTKEQAQEFRARRIVEHLVLGLQASLLLRKGKQVIAESYCSIYLGERRTSMYGGFDDQSRCREIIDYSLPVQ